jgi:hypothetical protein
LARSSSRVAPRGRVPAIGRYFAVADADEDFGARADRGEAREVEKIEERRGIDPPQRAVERNGRESEGASEALRQHDLEDVPGGDVVLGPEHHFAIAPLRERRGKVRLWQGGVLRGFGHRVGKPVQRGVDPVHGGT